MINLLPGGLVMINQMTMSARVFAAEGSAKHIVLAGRTQGPATANRRWRTRQIASSTHPIAEVS